MTPVTSMILRRIRVPLLVLITVYTVSIIGLVLTPGVDDQGNPYRVSIFQAFYFVTYTATTIGFGEIPYKLNDAQRLWVLIIIYITVTAWFYALGKILTLIQDKTFRDAVTRTRFKRNVRYMDKPFYLICGFGETGNAMVNALTEENYRAVVVDINPDNLNELMLNELQVFVPNITGDASDPETLELAGIRHPLCRGVIAVTPSDEVNLKIAITSKLLHPDIKVACRSEIKAFEENMLSFGTDYIVNPFETFANIFAMAMHSPSLHLIYDWLTGAPYTKLSDPVYFREGHWVLCSFGRFGKELFRKLAKRNIRTTIIEASGELRAEFESMPESEGHQFITGTGFDAETLTRADIQHSAGLIAGTDNDSNNLSIIMTARALNKNVFVVARQNQYHNHALYSATEANLVMRPREITARKIRFLFLAPMMVDYLQLASKQDVEWANITISRLSAIVGDSRPNIWSLIINRDKAPAIATGLEYGRNITIRHLITDPAIRGNNLKCVPLLLFRNSEHILMPDADVELDAFDRILFCGTREAENSMSWTIRVMSGLNYVMTFREEPESWVWRMIYRYTHKTERRHKTRHLEQ